MFLKKIEADQLKFEKQYCCKDTGVLQKYMKIIMHGSNREKNYNINILTKYQYLNTSPTYRQQKENK